MAANTIYKIVPEALWAEAKIAGEFRGAGVDLKDGYIHFSTEPQLAETAAKHFAGQTDLLLVAVDGLRLESEVPGQLKYEPSRGGALFPHLYGPLTLDAVMWEKPLPWADSGGHTFPEL